MKKTLWCGGVLLLSWLLSPLPAQQLNPSPPALSVRVLANQSVRLAWPKAVSGFALEQTERLSPSPAWQPATEVPQVEGEEFAVIVAAGNGSRFFRLRQEEVVALTTITETSPTDGETGVAVTRETIVHFSLPLSASAVLTTNNFYATFGGRRILSRIELATDRRKATLFYLEPLPGSARVNVFFDSAGLTDSLGRPLDPAGSGKAGGFKVIQFDTLSLTPLAGTAVIGRVFASELQPGPDTGTNAVNKPLAGVTITVDGMEQTVRAVTDAMGNFTLNNCPAGRFFVHIDGRTVTDVPAGIHYPDKAYYPFVGKAWDAIAGRTDNKAGGTGEIYLPLIKAGTLQPVSTTQDTTITFPPAVLADNPALAGVNITVPANSLFSDNGARGGKVGIAAVPPDRLPGPLPEGLELPIVITVQTDGALNFDQPAPICFPNLPDPVLKTPLPAGSKQALISFDHDKGIWEAVGSMTVSADGKFICTDQDVGILQPGWHGVGPSPNNPPPCSKLCCDGGGDGDPIGPVGGFQRSGRIEKAGKKPAQCKPKYPPCELPVSECQDRCAAWFSCDPNANKALHACLETLLKGLGCAKNPNPTPKCDANVRTCLEIFDKMRDPRCKREFLKCKLKCTECDPPKKNLGRPSKSGPADDLIADEIDARLSQISEILKPHLASNATIPAAVWEQIAQLFAEADEIAGGDASEFLDRHVRDLENNLAALEAEIGEEAGNAPPYPILYAAEITRGDTPLTLRGETGPFGQYSLFVPRDGELMHVSFYDPQTKRIGIAFPRLRPNAPYRMPRFTLDPIDASYLDRDQDGLADLVELVYGTDETNPDSDGDGIFDGAEIEQGASPLDGLPVRTGIIATAKTPGSAVDVWAGNDLAVTAEGTSGVSVFNIFKAMNPVLIAHLPTPGNARRVAASGNRLAVAAADTGLVIIDLTTPAEARIVHQVRLGNVAMVAAAGGMAYVGQSSGALTAVDLTTGVVLGETTLPGPLADLALAGDYLYARTTDRLFVLSLADGGLAVAGSVNRAGRLNQRLFAGSGTAWSVHSEGYDTFDVTDPAQPRFLTAGDTTQFGWRQLVPNGSGLGLAVVSPNPGETPQRDLWLYDLSDPQKNDVFLTQFVTPGIARAVALFNGLAYVADDTAGLQVVNYLAYDAKGVPPTIPLSTSGGGVAEGGRQFRVTANATDDVQVRNVEFYVDGQRTFSDGNFPFEYRFDPPALTATKTHFTLRARAIDTGGNFTWSEELTIALGPDVTPPRITATTPIGGAKVVNSVSVLFNEPINPASLNAASFQMASAGADGLLGTPDDLAVGGGAVTYHADSRSASLDFATPLPDGLYRARVTTTVADMAGNQLAADYAFQFRVADAVFWSRRTDGSWENAENWSGGALPGPNDNVIIDVPADVLVTHGAGAHGIKSLVANERLRFTAGTLDVGGTIESNQPLTMTGGTIRGSSMIVNGPVELGGLLEIPGTIELNQPMTLLGGTIKGATLNQHGAARLICAFKANNTLDGLTVNGDLNLTEANAHVRIQNGLTLSGSLLLDNGGTATFVGDQTFDNSTVVFLGNSGSLAVGGNTTLTLGPALVVRGKTGQLAPGVFVIGGSRKIVNRGLISADVAGGKITIADRTFENAGRIESKNGGSLDIRSANWSNAASGIIDAAGGALGLGGAWSNLGTISVNGVAVALSGTFKLADLGTFNRTGGTVTLSGVMDLNGGTLTLDASRGSWILNNGTIKNGTLTQQDGARLICAVNANNTLDGLTVNGDLNLTEANAHVRIQSGLTLSGSLLLDNGGTATFMGDQTFDNSTVVFLGNSGFLAVGGNTTLTLGPALVVRGKTGQLAPGAFVIGGNRKIVNRGLISADVAGGKITIADRTFENAGRIESKNGGSLDIQSANWSNAASGIIDAAGGALGLGGAWSNLGTISVNEVAVTLGGTFKLADLGTFNRTGGTVRLAGVMDLNGGTLTLDASRGSWILNNGTIKNGTLTQQDGARLICAVNANNTLDGLTVNGDLNLTEANAHVQIESGLTLNGSLLLDNSGTATFLGDQTFDNSTVVFLGNSGFLAVGGNTTLTLGPALVVRGKTGQLAPGVFVIGGSRKIVNRGLISADVAGGKITIADRTFENAGRIESKNGGSLDIQSANWSNAASGIIDAAGGALGLGGAWSNLGTISVNEVAVTLGGTFKLADLGTFNRTGGTVRLAGVMDLNGGTLTLDASRGSWILNNGTIKNGTLTQQDGARLICAVNANNTLDGLTVNGDLNLTEANAHVQIESGLTLNGSLLLDNSGQISFMGDQTFDNSTVVFMGNSGFLAVGGNMTLTLGPALVVRGKTGQLGRGVFNFGANHTIINRGLVWADAAGGTLTVNPSAFINNGVLRASDGGILKVTTPQFINTGTIEELNGGKVLINP